MTDSAIRVVLTDRATTVPTLSDEGGSMSVVVGNFDTAYNGGLPAGYAYIQLRNAGPIPIPPHENTEGVEVDHGISYVYLEAGQRYRVRVTQFVQEGNSPSPVTLLLRPIAGIIASESEPESLQYIDFGPPVGEAVVGPIEEGEFDTALSPVFEAATAGLYAVAISLAAELNVNGSLHVQVEKV